jgi:hypothetical protein
MIEKIGRTARPDVGEMGGGGRFFKRDDSLQRFAKWRERPFRLGGSVAQDAAGRRCGEPRPMAATMGLCDVETADP